MAAVAVAIVVDAACGTAVVVVHGVVAADIEV